NFARVFDMLYLDGEGQQQLCWTTSWGTSTRMVGGLIMAHGDDNGLVLPPNVAPTQCVVLLVKDDAQTADAARALTQELCNADVRALLDDRVDAAQTGFARAPWSIIGDEGEATLAQSSVTVRCLQRVDGSVPESDDEPDLVAYCARAY